MVNGVPDDKAVEAAKTLIQYCRDTGCLYCQFVDMDGPDIECDVRRPREWRLKDEQ